LICVPNFKITVREDKSPVINRIKSEMKLRPEDFARKKSEYNFNLHISNDGNGNKVIGNGIHSPRNGLNNEPIDRPQ
jgi:hypothetical protein